MSERIAMTAVQPKTSADTDRVRVAAVAMTVSGVVGIVLALASAIPGAPDVHRPVLVVMYLLALAGLGGLWISKACGDGWTARVGLGMAMLGTLISAPGMIVDAFSKSISGILFGGLVTPLTTVGMILAGIAMLRARRWTGWRRFTLLATGLYTPLFAASHVVVPLGAVRLVALGIWGLSYLLIGVSMWIEGSEHHYDLQ